MAQVKKIEDLEYNDLCFSTLIKEIGEYLKSKKIEKDLCQSH